MQDDIITVELLIAAKAKLNTSGASLVVLSKGYNPNDFDGQVSPKFFEGGGIRPLITAAQNPEIFLGATVADKVIGKAAALVLVYLKVKRVYAEILSQDAQKVLDANNIISAYKTLTKIILNKDNSAPCIMEQLVAQTNDPILAYNAIKLKLGI